MDGKSGPHQAQNNKSVIDLQSIRAKVKARVKTEEKQQQDKKEEKASGGDIPGGITSRFVLDCLNACEVGDGTLYAAIHRGKFLYNKNCQEWFAWQGHSWDHDILGSAMAAVEDVVDVYLQEALRKGEEIKAAREKENSQKESFAQKIQHDLYKRAVKLRTVRGRNNCLQCAHQNSDPLAIRGDETDLHPWLLAVQNGVINLKTGKLMQGRPGQYLTMASPVEWQDIETPAPLWEKTLLEIFDNSEPLVAYFQRLLGYAITGLTHEHIFPVLWGQGRNGKSMIVEIISRILGPLAGPIQSEMLLDSGRGMRNSAGPSPDIMGLKGLRIAFASETDEGRRFSPAKVKWLTGGDTLIGRNPNDKYQITFDPTHTLVLLTNHTPHANPDDFAFWERMHLVPFPLSFVDRPPRAENERPAIKCLRDRLTKEFPGILAWMMRGCICWQRNGLDPPYIVTEATKQYRRDEDILADFLEECCVMDLKAKVRARDIYDVFSRWYETNISKKGMAQRKFGAILGTRFEKRKVGGIYVYDGIGLQEDSGFMGA
jgi:putative DNA primase/helicase